MLIPKIRIIVAGSRTCTDYEAVAKDLDQRLAALVPKDVPIVIVCGEARGADTIGKMYAKANGYSVCSMPADWDTYGRSAGYKRNAAMANCADAALVYWDGQSVGSKHMIECAKKKGLHVEQIRYDHL